MSAIEYNRPQVRREDGRLVAGRGQYVDDIVHEGALFAAFVRSPYVSAVVRSIDPSSALELPGVVTVLTGADLAADGFNDCPQPFKLPQLVGFAVETPRPYLVRDRVRFVGEPVAMVLAQTEAAAREAADLVMVDYDEQPAVVDLFDAARDDAPQLWPDRPGNVAFHWRQGDVDRVAAALAEAHHVTHLRAHISRVSAMPLEPRAALAYTGEDGRPVLRISHQSPHLMRNDLAALFGLDRKDLRVIAGDVGGSFGMKYGPQREEVLVFWAARHLRRAVRWTASRSEAFLCDEQARDVFVTAELGLDQDGTFTALKVRYDVNVGAYMSFRSVTPIVNFGGIAGVYRTPAIVGEAVGLFTHTQSTAAYRGAGRPDATYAIERIIDVAAAELGLDPAELRRRNLIPPAAMPYQTPFVFKYDCGEFERNLDHALNLARYDTFDERRRDALSRGKLRGVGIAMPIEVAGIRGSDWTELRAHADGSVTLCPGSFSVGQGLETTLSSLVASGLGLPLDRVNYQQGDTDLLAEGRGSGGSAALIVTGSAVSQAVDDLIEKALVLAADHFEAAARDVEFAEGVFRVAGTDLVLGLGDVVGLAEARAGRRGAGLAVNAQFAVEPGTFPNGCHICEVEVDRETGVVDVVSYVAVEDVGRVLNPLLVDGQIHGGVAQGIGQALFEVIRHDEAGQLTTGSFMDYAMPRASDLPPFVTANLETPTALNPLGVKGVGEAGTVGGLAATSNAVCHALMAVGIRHLDMPASPARVWQALRDARPAEPRSP